MTVNTGSLLLLLSAQEAEGAGHEGAGAGQRGREDKGG